MLALLMLLSQRRNKKKQVINLDQDVQVCGDINIFFLWVVYELLFMNHPFSFIFLGCVLSYFFSLFFTCLVGVWHIFFGYASSLFFSLFL